MEEVKRRLEKLREAEADYRKMLYEKEAREGEVVEILVKMGRSDLLRLRRARVEHMVRG